VREGSRALDVSTDILVLDLVEGLASGAPPR